MTDEYSSLVIKINKELHKQIKATCAVNGISIKEYITRLVEKDMQEQNKKGQER